MANAMANACPRPLLPPVTIAVLPFSEKKSNENSFNAFVDMMLPLGLEKMQKKREKQPPLRLAEKLLFSSSLVTEKKVTHSLPIIP
ncbi:hypothetical protein [Serratia sp. AKBS12]|uniref:hypothetical protein n=1 Tax=Serratia sp. AKBS12 TaxID=2974597 RepID=UPI00216508F4|nr:hypothetical protein [Serratia sp. AKBS12]MCS3406832.1 hypothetical protein [Serratia sp. AKBS12]HEI8867215.1 hypothetical protein [Serratia odorifera]